MDGQLMQCIEECFYVPCCSGLKMSKSIVKFVLHFVECNQMCDVSRLFSDWVSTASCNSEFCA